MKAIYMTLVTALTIVALTGCNAMTKGADRMNTASASFTTKSDTQYPTQDLTQAGEQAEIVKQTF